MSLQHHDFHLRTHDPSEAFETLRALRGLGLDATIEASGTVRRVTRSRDTNLKAPNGGIYQWESKWAPARHLELLSIGRPVVLWRWSIDGIERIGSVPTFRAMLPGFKTQQRCFVDPKGYEDERATFTVRVRGTYRE